MLPETARQGIRAGKSVLPIVVTEDFTPESSFVLAGMEAHVISIDNPVSVFDLAIFVDVTAAQMAIRVEADARSIDVSSLSDLMTRLRSYVLKGLDLWGTTTADAVDSHFSNDLRAEAHLEASRASIGQYIEVSSVNATEQARTIPATLGASDIEARISAVWGRTLGAPTVPTDVSFFSLGGTSLSLLIMRKELEIDLQKNIPVSVLFECPTVQQLARYIAEFESTSHLGKEVSAGLLRAARIRERRSNIGQKI
jgi:acyl carrier protein